MNSRNSWLIAVGLGVLAVGSRLLPHAPNFTAVGAVALFAGSILPRKWALVVPMGILAATDVFLGGYTPLVMISVYASFAVIYFIGRWISKQRSFGRIALGTLSSSLLFFVITNFSVWAATAMYPKNFAGLISCFALAVPFFRNTLTGDIVFSGMLFGAYAVVHAFLTARQFRGVVATR